MMGKKERFIGEVYYNNDEFIIKESFSLVNSSKIYIDDERSRCAYMVISKEEAKELSGSLDDEQKVLNDIKNKYGAIVRQAIKEEEKYKKQYKDSFLSSVDIDSKIVYLQSIPIIYGKKFETFLKAKEFYCEQKNLDDEKKEEDISAGVAYLKKSKEKCNDILDIERKKFNVNLKTSDSKQAYALIMVPYVYNKKNEEMVLTLEEGTDSLTLMPKTKVEYGVFFDGTNNNMYNIEFYQNYKKYMSEQCEYINNNYTKTMKRENYATVIDIITYHPDPESYPNIMNLVRDEITDKIRYFQASANIKNNYGKDNASKDAKEVFGFLLEVRNTLKGEDSFLENMVESMQGINGVTGKEEEIDELIIKKILPSNSDSSSYTNGYTNIKRLYEHYEGGDSLSKNPNAHEYDLRRFRVYASGSGTVDPFDNNSLDDDSMIGLGLGLGKTGVHAHILYICHKIATELRDNKLSHIDELVLDTFGFSRGATEARHFVCSLQEKFELINDEQNYLKYALDTKEKDIFSCFYPNQDGLYTKVGKKVYFNPLRTDIKQISESVSAGSRTTTIYHKNPYYKQAEISIDAISFRHVNIVDTVTHLGVKQSNDWKDLKIDFKRDKVGSVFHLMAADEYRYNFDAYSIFKDKYEGIFKEEGNFKEFMVPGAHADVGGGYENFGSVESVKIMDYYSGNNNKIKAWNNKYRWIDNEDINIEGLDSFYNLEKDGIFYKKSSSYNQENVSGVIMCRTNLSWEYELVTLYLMHNEASDKFKNKSEKDRVPLNRLLDKYKLSSIKTLKEKELKLLYDIKEKLEEHSASTYDKKEKELHISLRSKFIHHSSSFGIVNKPSTKGNEFSNEEIYGKRSIYGSTGDKFS
ncbi:hypothetical protein CRV08_04980 [Halarcobacter ebronensis]|uniref:T6SS Phospholipase effector Tle1-like catalytic domain-containing protein n=1 Tax=Halarcobacter ebronensis TaxID=1462615 RepID=A0A4Q0YFL2_9BACT|nr:DUF2235 domain-containing protein [Halarcobacter ebronensis]RXJ69360.1 hypothetical protein CRV08_04980 [Halarcobacter ebronensis]